MSKKNIVTIDDETERSLDSGDQSWRHQRRDLSWSWSLGQDASGHNLSWSWSIGRDANGENLSQSWSMAKDASGQKSFKGKEKDTAEAKALGTVSVLRLYSFADNLDYVLMFFGCIGAICHGIALPLILLFFGNLLNGIGSTTNIQQTVDKYALAFLWMSLLCLGSSWLEIAFWMHTGQRQSEKLRAKYLEALLRQDVSYFDTETSTGEVVNSLATDTLAVQDAIGEKSGHFFHHIATFFASFLVGFSSEWRIAVVTIAIIPCLALTGGVYAFFLTRYTTKASSASSKAGSIAQQAISQVRTVYSFVAEEKFLKSYSDALHKSLKFGIKGGLVKGFGLGITMLVVFCCYAALFTYGGFLVRKGKANGGGVLATIFNVVIGSTSLALAMANIAPFGKARASAFKIFEVINHEPYINSPKKSAQLPENVEGLIELRDVDFSYPARPHVAIFRRFSLTIPPGKSVAIVGTSGSGKSTIISLVERFYDPTGGAVFLDGLNLKNLDLKWLRRQIGLVSQEPVLFATTIAANIVYGNATASQEEIEEAAKMANAHAFISQLPNGYQTQVGESGVQLSGGQRQRIAIARAIVKKPRILLLDEATSALDAGSEQVVQEALDRIMVGRTTVIVAHRLSTIRNADTIAVVEKGRIVERGTHHDLLSNDGPYSALVLLQELATSNEVNSYNDVSLEEVNPNVTSYDEMLSAGSPGRSLSFAAPEQQEKLVKASTGSMRRLVGMTKVDWRYGVGAIVGSMGAGCVGPLLAINLANVLSQYYDSNGQQFMKRNIAKLSWFFVGLGASTCIFYTLQHFSLGVVGEKLVARVREKLLAGILRNEVGWFDEADNNSSQLSARLASDAATVRAAIGDRVSVLLQTLTMILVSFFISFFVQWRLAFVMATVLPLITSANVFEQWILTRFAKDQAKAYDRATEVAGEAVRNIRTVAAFNAEDKVQVLFANQLDGPSKQSFRKGHIAGFGYGASQFLLYTSFALGLWYSGHLVVSGEATFQAVIKVFLIIVICGYMSAEAFSLAPDLVKGGQAVASVFEVMDRKTKIDPNNPEGEKSETIRGDIELRKVTLAYPSRRDVIVLKNMNLNVKSGNSLALVGASGSGKSSVIALIERFYDPLSGAILIDGKDIKNYNLHSLRQHIALVQQEPALFATTVYENIVYGKPGATEAEVIEAAKAANAHKFISSLPDGYKTLVGERGVQLSGGQKQRVAIASAVLKDPTIFLLDEATSALDAESEKVVQEAIDRLMTNRTTVMVAHRLSTIRRANSIAVLQDGSIAEQGSHTALVSKGGAYARLIRLQHQA